MTTIKGTASCMTFMFFFFKKEMKDHDNDIFIHYNQREVRSPDQVNKNDAREGKEIILHRGTRI